MASPNGRPPCNNHKYLFIVSGPLRRSRQVPAPPFGLFRTNPRSSGGWWLGPNPRRLGPIERPRSLCSLVRLRLVARTLARSSSLRLDQSHESPRSLARPRARTRLVGSDLARSDLSLVRRSGHPRSFAREHSEGTGTPSLVSLASHAAPPSDRSTP
jgi:hypothetical protein